MRSNGILSLYIWLFSSLTSIFVSIVGNLVYPISDLGYFWISIFLYFPMIPIHFLFIHIFRKLKHTKETMQWSMSTLLWIGLFLFSIQIGYKDFHKFSSFLLFFGLCQSFAYIQTFSLKPSKDKEIHLHEGMHAPHTSID